MRFVPVVFGVLMLAAVGCDGGPDAPTTPTRVAWPTGSYIVTLTASPDCAVVRDSVTGQTLAFPDAVRVRRYEVEFDDYGKGTLNSADTDSHVSVGAIMAGGELFITVPGDLSGVAGGCAGGDYWHERLQADFNFFELCGNWRGSVVNPGQIDGTIDGAFLYGEGPGYAPKRRQFCRASDHRFTMVRR